MYKNFNLIQNDPKWSKMIQIDPKFYIMYKNLILSKMIQNDLKWSLMIQIDPNFT